MVNQTQENLANPKKLKSKNITENRPGNSTENRPSSSNKKSNKFQFLNNTWDQFESWVTKENKRIETKSKINKVKNKKINDFNSK